MNSAHAVAPSNLPARRPDRILPHVGDRVFLPAALEIIETPPSPVSVSLMIVICAFAAATLTWCWFGRLDVYATARGKFVPNGFTKVVQPLEAGIVAAIKVKPNQEVKAGDIVVLLDSSEISAGISSDTETMIARRAEGLRRQAALSAVASGSLSPPAIPWSEDVPEGIRLREELVLAGDLYEFAATLAHLASQRLEKEATVRQLEASIAAEKRLIETLNQRIALRQALIDKKVGTLTGLIDATQTLREAETQLAGNVGKLGEALAAVASIDTDRSSKIKAFLADNTRKMAEANRLANEKEADRAKANVKLGHMILRAPADGVVQALAVTTVGQVVSPGQELMRLVPSNTPIEIQAFVTNEDIGFVSPGQNAIVKIDSFPFSRYGTLEATVEEVATDAISAESANRTLADPTKPGSQTAQSLTPTAQPMTDLVFEAKLRPNARVINVNDRDVPLSSGMTVTVEIKTGSRRIIEYLFSPLLEVAGKAMKER